jgi:hypothetical protein
MLAVSGHIRAKSIAGWRRTSLKTLFIDYRKNKAFVEPASRSSGQEIACSWNPLVILSRFSPLSRIALSVPVSQLLYRLRFFLQSVLFACFIPLLQAPPIAVLYLIEIW